LHHAADLLIPLAVPTGHSSEVICMQRNGACSTHASLTQPPSVPPAARRPLSSNPHRVSAFRSFQPELPVTPGPSRSRPKQNAEPGKLHRFTSNVRTAPLTDHHGWNGEAFPCPVVAYTKCQEEKSPRWCSGSEHGTAQHRNSHALLFGT